MVLWRLQLLVKCLLLYAMFSIDGSNSITLDTSNIPEVTKLRSVFLHKFNERNKIVELQCVITKHTENTNIDFYFHEKLIDRNNSRIQSITPAIIQIKDIKYDDDDGIYKCIVCNNYGCSMKTTKVEIPVIGSFLTGNRYGDPIKKTDVVLNRYVEIMCPTHTISRPLTVRWGSQGPTRFLEASDYINFVNNDIIYVSNVTNEFVDLINKKFKGISCVLLTNQRMIFSAKIMLNMRAPASDNSFAPIIYQPFPGKSFVENGEEFTFKCLASGNPRPNIKWYFNNREIVPGNYMFDMDTEYPKSLTIEKFDRRYQGKYECVLENEMGKESTYGNLSLAEKPKIVDTLSSIGILKNRTVNISCEAYGTRPMTIHWLRDGISVEKDTRISIEDGRLLIQNTTVDNTGTYQCIAKNQFGEDSQSFNFVVVSTESELAQLYTTVPSLKDNGCNLQSSSSFLTFITLLISIIIYF